METRSDDLSPGLSFLRGSVFLLCTLAFAVLCSCSGSSSIGKRSDVQQWNIELNTPLVNKCSGESMLSIGSDIQPQYLPATSTYPIARLRVLAIDGDCQQEQDMIYELPVSAIKRITYVSDPLTPPRVYKPEECPPPPDRCCRQRTGALGFDKLELRGMVGARGRDDETYLHQTAEGKVPYESKFLNFERGGSTLLLGVETAGLWSLDDADAFQIGPFLGVWPVDGSVFVPFGVHPRYTFNPNPDPSAFTPNCNTWFVYGDLGIPFDFQSGAPVFGSSSDRQRLYYGIGIGHDWAWGCARDFSLDIGVRRMNLPLPEIECCPDVPSEQRNAYRQSTSVYLRFGVTF